MNNPYEAQHDLKSDVHNLLTLLQFIKEDERLKDPTLTAMLNKCLERKEKIAENLEVLKEIIKVTNEKS